MMYKEDLLNPEEIDSDLSESETEESDEENKLDAASLSAFDMILKSMWKIDVFLYEFVKAVIEGPYYTIAMREQGREIIPQDMLRNNLVKKPLESDGVSNLYVNMTKLIFPWSLHFQVREGAVKICNQCKTETRYYSDQQCYGISINANSLREFKSAFKDFTFENILKAIRINLKMPCHKEGCGKLTYVETMIYNLPSAFTIAIEWEENETEEEIFETVSVIETEIDISGIYRYEGEGEGEGDDTKYNLVSMVCSDGDLYNCVAYERDRRWVRYYCSETEREVIGDWDSVLKLHIRPDILFFENVMKKDDMIAAL